MSGALSAVIASRSRALIAAYTRAANSLPPTTAPTLSTRQLVAGRLQRAGALPAPDQQHVLVRGVVEPVPVPGRREDHVSRLRRLPALVRVDLAAAAHHDEELVAVRVAVALVPGAR